MLLSVCVCVLLGIACMQLIMVANLWRAVIMDKYNNSNNNKKQQLQSNTNTSA